METIAVPLAKNVFCAHFGGADAFALFPVVSPGSGSGEPVIHPAPPHEPGAYPRWLRGLGVTTVLAGGMGGRAVQMFSTYGIDVVTGIEGGDPAALVRSYLAGTLSTNGAVCGGGLHGCGGHDH